MNLTIFYFLHNFLFRSPLFDSIVWFFAVPFIYIVIIMAIVFIFIHYNIFPISNIFSILRKSWKDIFYIPFSVIIARLIAEFLKNLIHMNRPPLELANVRSLFLESGYAFPSGHATIASAIAFAIFFENKRLGYIFMVAALLIGIARIIAGVHFPIDIMGGYILGFLVAFLIKNL